MAAHRLRRALFLLLLAACALPWVGGAHALVGGTLFSLVLGNPWPERTSAWSKGMLQVSVVGLGFGLSTAELWQVGKGSVLYTVVGIALTLTVGMLLGRFFGAGKRTATLISFGTAVCGGSAIAAMTGVLGSKDDETAVALATVFTLNAVALVLFPFVGHQFGLSQHQFGLWAALAIHDTSSVVGAAAAYGSEALSVGTTVKLVRAMWIVPLALVTALLLRREHKGQFPLFILFFVLAAVAHSLLPAGEAVWSVLAGLARRSLVVTLFLIGAGLSRPVLARVGLRPLAQGATLWLLVSSVTLAALLNGWLS